MKLFLDANVLKTVEGVRIVTPLDLARELYG